MSLLKILLSVFLVLLPVSVTCQTLAYCRYPLSCGVGEPQIRFPFALYGRQSKSCGNSGYDLSCNSSNKTVLQLPYSEQLFVKEINYTSQEMQIYDPDNCLTRRLLKLRFPLLFPYKLAGSNQNYTILNCSSSSVDVTNTSLLYTPISCMSSSTNTIFSTDVSNPNLPFKATCEIIATVSSPAVRTVDGLSYKTSDVLLLKWQLLPDRSQGTKVTEAVYALLGLCFALVLILAFTCCICPWVIGLFRDHHRSLFLSDGILLQSTVTNQEVIIIRTGLDDATIKSYRRIHLDEKLQLPNPTDTTCSICLSEYRPTESLKLIPPCNHCFHAKCIDPWLRMHTTCPVCRKSLQCSVLLPAAGAWV
ncbi:putative RING-H2 finger protein ATL21A [Papaver somniferum]|uniref:putative RING-H2 finger protein ATL21A n=1 Tax=Papaver somniferum TaxID=3469 RepID=UPI000E6FFE58|nr:putative RING-H2 finger protein ATL21A [Papaver somniferum]